METIEKFEAWALLELFGHNRIAGKVTEQTIGGGSFVRVDVPETTESKPFTRLLNPSAIYAINPVTEEVARGLAESIRSKPIEAWDARDVISRIEALKAAKQIAPASNESYEPFGEDEK